MPLRTPDDRINSSRGIMFRSLMLLFLVPVNGQAAWQAPLTSTEKTTAESVALDHSLNGSDELRSAEYGKNHPLGIQVLSIEPREQKKTENQASKTAEVFTFNHHTHTAKLTLVDLTTNSVIRSQQVLGVHLPLSDQEIEYSINLARNDAQVQAKLYEEHISQAHDSNDDVLSGLQLRVSVWVPTTDEHAGDSGCDFERCALISLYDANNVSYATEPVINLKTGTVRLDLIQ